MIYDQIRLHENFTSDFLSAAHDVWVYLPPTYGVDPLRRFPVFYMQDGQNLFNPAASFGGIAWQADETAQRLIFDGSIEPLIIVGISNSAERLDEYTPVPSPYRRLSGGGHADDYGKMLIEELKPFIDRTYATLPDREFTGIGGSSLGGLASLHLAFQNPHVFSRVAAISPSIWWANNQITREISKMRARLPLKIWLDIGADEGARIKHQVRALRETLLADGWTEGVDLKYTEIPHGQHNEAAWAARFDQVLKFLFPARRGVSV